MKAIIVDDERLMLHKFVRLTSDISDLVITGTFESGEEAVAFAENNPIEAAFLDVEMPQMSGLELARKLREIRRDILIIFITAYDEYIRDSNELGGDMYIIKPYTKEVLNSVMEKLRLLSARQSKDIYIQTFGRFLVKKEGKPIRLTGKAKEILALVVTRRGKEISNEEIYSTLWDGRPYSNRHMSVYYNALRRLKNALEDAGIADILVSTSRGQTVNTSLFDCDYYAWKDREDYGSNSFEGEFLSEYSWGEYILADILHQEWEEAGSE